MRHPSPFCRCTLQILTLLRTRGLCAVAQRLSHGLRNVVADPVRRFAKRVVVEMSIALCRGCVGVA